MVPEPEISQLIDARTAPEADFSLFLSIKSITGKAGGKARDYASKG